MACGCYSSLCLNASQDSKTPRPTFASDYTPPSIRPKPTSPRTEAAPRPCSRRYRHRRRVPLPNRPGSSRGFPYPWRCFPSDTHRHHYQWCTPPLHPPRRRRRLQSLVDFRRLEVVREFRLPHHLSIHLPHRQAPDAELGCPGSKTVPPNHVKKPIKIIKTIGYAWN